MLSHESRVSLKSPAILAVLLLITGGILGFIKLREEVLDHGGTQSFDDYAIRSLRRADDPGTPLGPTWMHEIGRDVTALGGVFCVTLVSLSVTGFLLLDGKRRTALFVLVAVVGGALLSGVLKFVVSRPRPDLVPHLSDVLTTSFPSGHSMLSAVVYLTLGTMLARTFPSRWLKFYFIAIAIIITVMVGVSRVYMGVHYPTDVLAGWCAGLSWALMCWFAETLLQKRGTVEKPDPEIS